MVVASIIVSSLLAAAIGYSALLKLTHRPEVVDSYRRAGVPEHWLNGLAAVLLAAATALVAGIWWAPVGIAASAGLIAYFAIAVAFHVRAKVTKNAATPVALTVLAMSAFGLLLLSR
jgi:hypothetical protein